MNSENLILKSGKSILFVGKRLDPIQKAVELGFETYVLNLKKPKFSTKSFGSKKYSEMVFNGNYDMFKNMSFDAIIPLTEKSIPIAQQILKKSLSKKADLEKFNLCHDKFEMKNHARKHHIPITDFILIDEATTPEELAQKFGFPIVLKERDSSGSRGLVIANSIDGLSEMKPNMLAEKYIKGKEYSVESFVCNGEIIFSNTTDYHTHHVCNIVPAKLDEISKDKLSKFNSQIIKTFGIKNGIAHVEYYLTEKNILFGEIAIRPPGGYIMKLIELCYGFSPWKTLIDIECGKAPSVKAKSNCHAAVWILHPGEGVVEREPDYASLLQDPNLVDIQSGLKSGMTVKKREGSGEDFGRILMQSQDYNSLLETIKSIEELV
ncbi:MAG: ATP-grasp domain-containing protein [Bdellovibrionota bacterium]